MNSNTVFGSHKRVELQWKKVMSHTSTRIKQNLNQNVITVVGLFSYTATADLLGIKVRQHSLYLI